MLLLEARAVSFRSNDQLVAASFLAQATHSRMCRGEWRIMEFLSFYAARRRRWQSEVDKSEVCVSCLCSLTAVSGNPGKRLMLIQTSGFWIASEGAWNGDNYDVRQMVFRTEADPRVNDNGTVHIKKVPDPGIFEAASWPAFMRG